MIPLDMIGAVWPLVHRKWGLLEGVDGVGVDPMYILGRLLAGELQLWTYGVGEFWIFTSLRGKVVEVEYLFGEHFALKMQEVLKTLRSYAVRVGAETLRARVTEPRLVKPYERLGWKKTSVEMEFTV